MAAVNPQNGALGPKRPYNGFAGYVKVTQLTVPDLKGALFVELHTAFAEPKDWFGGQNVIGSKMPIKAKENVESFRRALRAAVVGQ